MPSLVSPNGIRAESNACAALRHLLPPRPAGLLSLLDGSPDADVVVVNHAGLDLYPTFVALAENIPLTRPIEVTATRIPRRDIPDDAAERVAWLDGLWCAMDDWVHDQLTP